MIRRYNLRRSDNAPKVGRKSYACSGTGLCSVLTSFPVTSAIITWSSVPLFETYGAEYQSMSSSSSSTSSSSSRDSSSSTSSRSPSSVSTSSSSSTYGVTSSSSSRDSTSSSSSKYDSSTSSRSSLSSVQYSSSSSSGDSGSSTSIDSSSSSSGYDYCYGVGFGGGIINQLYTYNGIVNGKPSYVAPMLFFTPPGVHIVWSGSVWQINGDGLELYKNLTDSELPPEDGWMAGSGNPFGIAGNIYFVQESSSSLSSSSTSSSSTNPWTGSFNKPRIYVYDYLPNGFRVKYENIPEEMGYIEFSYFAQ